MYSQYYQAYVRPKDGWFLVAILKSYDHLVMDRTIDPERSIFEFFVPESMEEIFLELMHYFEQQGIVRDLTKMPNRLMTDQLV